MCTVLFIFHHTFLLQTACPCVCLKIYLQFQPHGWNRLLVYKASFWRVFEWISYNKFTLFISWLHHGNVYYRRTTAWQSLMVTVNYKIVFSKNFHLYWSCRLENSYVLTAVYVSNQDSILHGSVFWWWQTTVYLFLVNKH